jgi:hypothetical protein
VSHSTFSRNLVFECIPVVVAPTLNQTYCHTRLPVQDLKSNLYFLDSFTNILMPTAAIAPCLHSITPIYKTTAGDMVTYTPNRAVVNFETNTTPNNNQTNGKKGI